MSIIYSHRCLPLISKHIYMYFYFIGVTRMCVYCNCYGNLLSDTSYIVGCKLYAVCRCIEGLGFVH